MNKIWIICLLYLECLSLLWIKGRIQQQYSINTASIQHQNSIEHLALRIECRVMIIKYLALRVL